MSAPRLNAATANLMLDAGFGNRANSGKLAIYDGTQPAAGGGAVTTQVKLAEFTFSADAFPAAASAVLTANAIGPSAALASGTPAWFRITTSGGVHILDG